MIKTIVQAILKLVTELYFVHVVLINGQNIIFTFKWIIDYVMKIADQVLLPNLLC